MICELWPYLFSFDIDEVIFWTFDENSLANILPFGQIARKCPTSDSFTL